MTTRRILVLGATGGTGQQLVVQALQRGHMVSAFARNPGHVTITSDRLRLIEGNVTTDDQTLTSTVRDQDVVISALGLGKSFKSDGLIGHAMPRIVRAMEAQGIRRLVFTSAFGVGETYRDAPFLPRVFIGTLLRDIYRDKEAGEAELLRSNLDWTLVYPTGLTDGPATGQYRKGERLSLRGLPTIARADVADFLLSQIDDTTYIRKRVLISS